MLKVSQSLIQKMCVSLKCNKNERVQWRKLHPHNQQSIFICRREEIESLLSTIYTVSEEFNLRINAKKCAIFAVRRQKRILSEADLRGIPVTNDYPYLGVIIDDSESIEPQLQWMQQRLKYVQAHIRYYVKHLSFENQMLLWQIYVKLYFTYTAPVVQTQTLTMQKRFHSIWRNDSTRYGETISKNFSDCLQPCLAIFSIRSLLQQYSSALMRRQVQAVKYSSISALTNKVETLIANKNNKFRNRCQQQNQIHKYQPRHTQPTHWKEREQKQQLKIYHSASRRCRKALRCSSSSHTNGGNAIDGE